MNVLAKFAVVPLPVPEIIAIAVSGCEPPILGKGRQLGVVDGTVLKSIREFL